MGKIIGLVILVAAIWHFKVAKTDGVRITGLFKEEPEYGYAWKGSYENGPRNFWDKTEVSWMPGLKHPQYNVQAGLQVNNWVPVPGYSFVNNEPGNFETAWQAGLVHPLCKAWSAAQEGYWIPMPGYRFTRNINGDITGTEWEPGQKSDQLKVMAAQKADTYIPYPGYRFVKPGVNLEVAWTPGMRNPDYSNQVASQTEGYWEEVIVDSYVATEPSTEDLVAEWLVKGIASQGLKEIVGDNIVSDKLMSESTSSGLKALVNGLKN